MDILEKEMKGRKAQSYMNPNRIVFVFTVILDP